MRLGLALVLVGTLATSATLVSAAKPTTNAGAAAKASATVTGFDVVVSYQVNRPTEAIVGQSCSLTDPDGTSEATACDGTPNNGSGKKLTKYTAGLRITRSGSYSFAVDITLVGGQVLPASAAFTIVPGAAVRFEVSGLVGQEARCPDVGLCGPDAFARQIAKVTALDAFDNVATGYAGTVTFQDPEIGFVTDVPADQTLTNGVGYFPVVVPYLPLNVSGAPYNWPCPGFFVALYVRDSIDGSIEGCQSVNAGAITRYVGAVWEVVSPPECPTDCFADPTGTILIDTSLVQPTLLVNQLSIDGAMILTGQTSAGLYFTQESTIVVTYIEGSSIPLETLLQCEQCLATDNYFTTFDNITVSGTLDFRAHVPGIIIPAPAPFVIPPPPTSPILEVVTVSNSVGIPKCYIDAQLTEGVACLFQP